MEYIKNQDCLLNEGKQFLTEEELLEIDGILCKTGEEMIKKTGEICDILRKRANADYRLSEAYRLAVLEVKDLLDGISKLEKSEAEKEKLMNKQELLQKKCTDLEQENTALKAKLTDANLKKTELEDTLSKKEADYKTLESESKRIQEDYKSYYKNARVDKDNAEANQKKLSEELEQEKENNKLLQDQYVAQNKKMPTLMSLYHAYNDIMEKNGKLPKEFFERLPKVMPLDDFDGFLPMALNASFPTSYYEMIRSFMKKCYQSEVEVGEEGLKEALLASDALLTAVFDIRKKQFKEEGLIRIEVKAGEDYDSDLCKYINDKGGGMYGKIARVWLHGFRDEKSDITYQSYVEGEGL